MLAGALSGCVQPLQKDLSCFFTEGVSAHCPSGHLFICLPIITVIRKRKNKPNASVRQHLLKESCSFLIMEASDY